MVAALTAGVGVTGTASAGAELRWAPCPENAAVECASLAVPIDWDRPQRGSIEIAVARAKATGQREGVLLHLPGGPGGSGVGALVGGGVLTPELAERFDIVSIDPRGTNRSHPVRCPSDVLSQMPDLVPETGGRHAELKAYSRRLGEACRALTGPLIDHVDAVSVARDIDALRAALGERRLSVYGISYGTLTGQMYAERFPHRVRALLLDSVFDHSLPTRRFLATEARAGEDSFAEFVRWCARESSCALHGQDVGEVYTALYQRAVRGELRWPDEPGERLDVLMFVQTAIGRLYGPDWPGLADFLDALTRAPAPTPAPTPAQTAAEATDMPIAAFCGDHDFAIGSQRDWERAWRDMRREAPTVGGHFAWVAVSLCADWPADTGNPQHRTDVDGGPVVLLMNSRFDPATPLEWAESVDRQLDRSFLLTYEGWGHRVYDRSGCTLDATHRYFLDGRLPTHSRCSAVEPTPADTAPAESAASPAPVPGTGW
ncbi:alpha/beta hydrolase [Actinokineospora guangxiensis]|uniref:Alpha/beta hydrolase n=1 Tax=Actinokineospora guangxiensis TaxID=1490288 RepID=A0ABW0EI30_9PSEU